LLRGALGTVDMLIYVEQPVQDRKRLLCLFKEC